MKDKQMKGVMLYVFIFLVIIIGVSLSGVFDKKTAVRYDYRDFMNDLNMGQVTDIVITQNKEVPTGTVSFKVDGVDRKLSVSDVNEVVSELKVYKTPYIVKDVPKESWILNTLLPYGLIIGVFIFLFMFISNQSQGGSGAGKAMSFGKSRARLSTEEDKKINFKHVAGLDEEKDELKEIVDFLKSPKKYIEVGARIPKGVLLVGPPGTGKTLLAKAVAGEAGVPFFSISGSDFVEMFVGVGASRVRDLFSDAKKNLPCIVFIDEIDAVARRRGTGMGGGHDEREQTLNQLLVEMDGFGVNEGIIVMAATNRVDILDPAILRPGRFDRKVMVGRPDVKGRQEILKVHSKNKPLAEDVNLEKIAQTTPGFSGADIENLMNEAAIYAARSDRKYILQADIQYAFVKVGVGTEKKSRVITEKEKRLTAYHEAGHAILYHVLPDVGPVYTISIIPTGHAGGYTMPIPSQDYVCDTKAKMLQEIKVCMGGRIAEELVLGDISTGASQDIKSATEKARAMVMQYGMSDRLGFINYDSGDEVFIGRDMGQVKAYSDTTAAQIDDEVRKIIDTCYKETQHLIVEHRNILEKCAELLIEKEKVTREEFENLFEEANKQLELDF